MVRWIVAAILSVVSVSAVFILITMFPLLCSAAFFVLLIIKVAEIIHDSY